MKKKIIILYHSGSGSTKTISEVFKEKLYRKYSVDIESISNNFDYNRLSEYNLVILGFPTYHCEPSTSMIEFVKGMPVFNENIKAFVFTTCGLYSGNAIRILIKKILQNKVIASNYCSITGPASDGILLFPLTMSHFFYKLSYVLRYQFTTKWKLKKALRSIDKIMQTDKIYKRIPFYKWYVPINNILKYKGEKEYNNYKDNLSIIEEKCSNCNLCVKNCLRNCWTKGAAHPELNSSNCEFCLKCVHSCPNNSIIFSNKMENKPRFDNQFYKELKNQILRSIERRT